MKPGGISRKTGLHGMYASYLFQICLSVSHNLVCLNLICINPLRSVSKSRGSPVSKPGGSTVSPFTLTPPGMPKRSLMRLIVTGSAVFQYIRFSIALSSFSASASPGSCTAGRRCSACCPCPRETRRKDAPHAGQAVPRTSRRHPLSLCLYSPYLRLQPSKVFLPLQLMSHASSRVFTVVAGVRPVPLSLPRKAFLTLRKIPRAVFLLSRNIHIRNFISAGSHR